MSSIADRVKYIIARQGAVKVEELGPSTNLRDDLGFDSLDDVEVIIDLENEFDIEIPSDSPPATVGEVIKYISGRVQ